MFFEKQKEIGYLFDSVCFCFYFYKSFIIYSHLNNFIIMENYQYSMTSAQIEHHFAKFHPSLKKKLSSEQYAEWSEQTKILYWKAKEYEVKHLTKKKLIKC